MNFKEKFLELTQYSYPYGTESELEPYLPKGLTKDEIGNYHLEIGNSETLFVCHLDTISYTRKKEKINHIIEGDIIKTDGETTLGGDNKCGVVILSYLIENNIPGCYYFFVGEEPPFNMLGSRTALNNNPQFFQKFKRVIAFDRKKDHSIITVQMGQKCCSDEFANALKSELNGQGLNYDLDPTGIWTDSAAFMHDIPEVTNLSSGVWNEHTTNEYVNISILEKIAKAAVNVDWESLPTVRKIKIVKNYESFLHKIK